MLLPAVVWAALAGVLSHVTYFMHGEHQRQGPVIFRISILLILILFTVELKFKGNGVVQATAASASIIAAFLTSLFASMTVYRVCFHRLKEFPGPFVSKVTKFWHAWILVKREKNNHEYLHELHKKYGDFVRTGKYIF